MIDFIIFLLVLLVICLLVSSKKKKQSNLEQKIEKTKQSEQTEQEAGAQSTSTISTYKKTDSTPLEKKIEQPEKIDRTVKNDSSKPKSVSSRTRKQKQSNQQESDNIDKALKFYEIYELENKELFKVEDLIQDTANEKLFWIDGINEDGSVEVWTTDYQKGLLALYKDMRQKKYQLVFFYNEKAFLQPYAKLVELRKTIVTQIENRKKRIEHVPTNSFLVRTNTFKCTKSHGIEDIIAVFTVLSKYGKVINVETPAGHCMQCGVFYIHDYIYQKLLTTYGQPMCTVITEKQYISGAYLKMNTGMAQQSLLRMCGYTVSASEGLSDKERRRILDTIISNGIMSKFDIGYSIL